MISNDLPMDTWAEKMKGPGGFMADQGIPQLEEELGRLLRAKGLTISVAESCTGGLLASRITDVPGSSDYFVGGIVAYRNEIKERVLGVPREILKEHGAVSEMTAEAMARGCRDLFASDIAVAVTGIAGPGGGTRAKPVGLTYIAVHQQSGTRCERFDWKGDRLSNKENSVRVSLEMAIEALVQ
jgi:PncC family amidohydrolase